MEASNEKGFAGLDFMIYALLKTVIGSHMEWTLLKAAAHKCRARHWTAERPPRVVGLKLSQIARQKERLRLPHREIQTKQIEEGAERTHTNLMSATTLLTRCWPSRLDSDVPIWRDILYIIYPLSSQHTIHCRWMKDGVSPFNN